MLEKLDSLRAAYQARLAAGDLKPNRAQAEAVEILQIFSDRLRNYDACPPQKTKTLSAWLADRFAFLAGKKTKHHPLKCSLYLYGKVGRGKSMLMDLFMGHVEVAKKRRVHFHQFMLEIHARLNRLRQEGGSADIMETLAEGIASETSLLAFDEFHVNNIADAMILGRLFSGLFAAGVVVIATSNWAPDELYKNGLQRDRFLPFIDLIKERMQVHEIGGTIDYRYEQLRYLKSYFSPLGLETTRALQGIFLDLTHDATPVPVSLQVDGRQLTLSRAAHGIGFFNFDELCKQALGSADYLAIAECLHTVILDGVPQIKNGPRDETVRFMTLIDALYEAKVTLFMASAVPVERLASAEDLAVAFERTASRLMEMQGENYRRKSHLS